MDVWWIGNLLEFFEDHVGYLNFLWVVTACLFRKDFRRDMNTYGNITRRPESQATLLPGSFVCQSSAARKYR